MTTFIFLRHGQSRANAEGWLSGWDDVELTPTGEEQATAAAVSLRDVEIGRCLVSDLRRARHTAALALSGRRVPMHVLPELRERHMGCLQGQVFAEVRADGRSERWLLPWHEGAPGGESHALSVSRACAALRWWDDGTPTLVVAHGALIRDLVGLLDGEDAEAIPRGRAAPHATPIHRVVSEWRW